MNEQKTCKRSREHPAFNPPAGDVTEKDVLSERFQYKRHFVWCEIYKVEVGHYRDNDAKWRKMPDSSWKRGLGTLSAIVNDKVEILGACQLLATSYCLLEAL